MFIENSLIGFIVGVFLTLSETYLSVLSLFRLFRISANPPRFQVTPDSLDKQLASHMDNKQFEVILDALKDLGERVLTNENSLGLINSKLVSP